MAGLKTLIVWLVTSSKDPARLSLTVAGVLTLGGAYVLQASDLLCGLGMLCLGINGDWVQAAVNAVTTIVVSLAALSGAIMTVTGLVRKINLGRWTHPSA